MSETTSGIFLVRCTVNGEAHNVAFAYERAAAAALAAQYSPTPEIVEVPADTPFYLSWMPGILPEPPVIERVRIGDDEQRLALVERVIFNDHNGRRPDERGMREHFHAPRRCSCEFCEAYRRRNPDALPHG